MSLALDSRDSGFDWSAEAPRPWSGDHGPDNRPDTVEVCSLPGLGDGRLRPGRAGAVLPKTVRRTRPSLCHLPASGVWPAVSVVRSCVDIWVHTSSFRMSVLLD